MGSGRENGEEYVIEITPLGSSAINSAETELMIKQS